MAAGPLFASKANFVDRMERSGMRGAVSRIFGRFAAVHPGYGSEERIMPGETVLCSVAKGVALVTLNNPPLNLVTLEMTRELNALVARLASDDSVRGMGLRGSRNKG